jgi:uncharacterized protein YdeI (YjbR/CyaY-like superfamily)
VGNGGVSGPVDRHVAGLKTWRAETMRLREIVTRSGLEETLKWGKPCYALDGANVALIHGFKGYCALLFFKGALLKDEAKLLVRQTENVQAARQMRFTGLDDVEARTDAIASYLEEAVAIARAGAQVGPAPAKAPPPEFKRRLEADAELTAAFAKLTPGRQRAYLLHFAGAKQAATRESRILRARPRILAGEGLDD